MARSPIERHLAPYSETIYALFRFVFGLLFWCHGAQKLLGWFGGGPEHLNTLMLIAGLIEFGCGALIAVGLFAGPAAFLASGQMAAAYFMVHSSRGGLWPIENKGELAVLYCFAFLLIAARGSGKLSVDASR